MNFIRPEVRAGLWRWREVLITGALVVYGVYILGRGIDRSSVTLTGLGAVITGLFAVLLFWAILRAKLYKPVSAAGVVEVKEREVGYLAPDGGAYVSLDNLTRLEIVTNDKGPAQDDVFWVLTHLGGEPLYIPASAQGSDLLFDAFAALKGVNFEEAVRAMGSTENARFVIWEKRILH
ncbi:hypothetical protein [Neptunicoccus cionae]|uniref:DUF4175 domain-containing protein n=1 Tax=Neptunicoccus cionae TaxID=2035344 RepID=A0A916QTS2_9RHOB|nr:hypothetical protein [Amylibacter cionae]GGA06964.1 hypothetical protein GCM10011498_03500 [Amylibacter cionae]